MVRPPPAPCVCLLPLLCCAIVILAYLSYVKEFRGEFSGVLREEQAVVEERTMRRPRLEFNVDLSPLHDILAPDCSSPNSNATEKLTLLLSEESVQARLRDCDEYFRTYPVSALTDPAGEEDATAALAFSHQVHRDVAIIEMFLAATFRPQNVHCVHVDKKAPKEVHDSVSALAKCYGKKFGNETIFVISNPISVYWGHISVLDADLACLRELRKRHDSWEFYINTAGTELPMVDYKWFVETVRSGKNKNIMESYELPRYHRIRIKRPHTLQRCGEGEHDFEMAARSASLKSPPPFGLTVYKGVKNVVITRNFSNFVLDHPVATEFYKWLEDAMVPDEMFFQTLARIKEVSPDLVVIQDDTLQTSEEYMPRYTLWLYFLKMCHGRWIRSICNFALGDLDALHNRPTKYLVANKFNLDVDPAAPVCHWRHIREKNFLPADKKKAN